MDVATDMDYLVMANQGHVLIQTDIAKSVIEGDKTTVLHVAANHTLTLGNELAVRAVIEEGATLAMADDVDFTISKPTMVYGTFKSLDDDDSNLFIGSIFHIAPQVLHLTSMTVQSTGNMTVIDESSPLVIDAKKLFLEGNFDANEVEAVGWVMLVIGPEGTVTFDPINHEQYLGTDILILGALTLLKTISIRLPCDKFEIDGGILEMEGTENITIECLNVTINGVFEPHGMIDVGAGLPTFHVGPLGWFVFTLNGDFLCDNADISGVMTSKYPITMRGRVRENVHTFIIGPHGDLTLDPNSQEQHNWTDVSRLSAHSVTIFGRMRAGLLSIADVGTGGWDYLFIGETGRMEFHPASQFRCDVIEIDGVFEAYANITVTGHVRDNVQYIIIGPVGELTLDSDSQEHHNWTDVSKVGAHSVKISGQMRGGLLSITDVGTGGWDYLHINETGRMEFHPASQFLCDAIDVDGQFESYGPVLIKAHKWNVFLALQIGPHGGMHLDSNAYHPSGPWTNQSAIIGGHFAIKGPDSNVQLGGALVEVGTVSIGGYLTVDAVVPIKTDSLEVTGTGHVETPRPVDIRGLSAHRVGNLTIDGYGHIG